MFDARVSVDVMGRPRGQQAFDDKKPSPEDNQVQDSEHTPSSSPVNNVCANTMDVKIKDVDKFIQNVPGLHQIMVFGDYTRTIGDALLGMNVTLVGPADFVPPQV